MWTNVDGFVAVLSRFCCGFVVPTKPATKPRGGVLFSNKTVKFRFAGISIITLQTGRVRFCSKNRYHVVGFVRFCWTDFHGFVRILNGFVGFVGFFIQKRCRKSEFHADVLEAIKHTLINLNYQRECEFFCSAFCATFLGMSCRLGTKKCVSALKIAHFQYFPLIFFKKYLKKYAHPTINWHLTGRIFF